MLVQPVCFPGNALRLPNRPNRFVNPRAWYVPAQGHAWRLFEPNSRNPVTMKNRLAPPSGTPFRNQSALGAVDNRRKKEFKTGGERYGPKAVWWQSGDDLTPLLIPGSHKFSDRESLAAMKPRSWAKASRLSESSDSSPSKRTKSRTKESLRGRIGLRFQGQARRLSWNQAHWPPGMPWSDPE